MNLPRFCKMLFLFYEGGKKIPWEGDLSLFAAEIPVHSKQKLIICWININWIRATFVFWIMEIATLKSHELKINFWIYH
jgi:hypothetical protein